MTERKPVTARSGASPDRIIGLDGQSRTPKAEQDLNSLFAAVLSGDRGDRLMTYLRTITQQRVLTPGASDAELRDLEGQRWLVAMMMERARHGREQR